MSDNTCDKNTAVNVIPNKLRPEDTMIFVPSSLVNAFDETCLLDSIRLGKVLKDNPKLCAVIVNIHE